MTLADKLRECIARGEVGAFLGLALARFALNSAEKFEGNPAKGYEQRDDCYWCLVEDGEHGEGCELAELEREVCGG